MKVILMVLWSQVLVMCRKSDFREILVFRIFKIEFRHRLTQAKDEEKMPLRPHHKQQAGLCMRG